MTPSRTDPARHVRDALEGAVATLDRMLRVDTSFPPGAGYAAFADLMEDVFRPFGFAFERVEVPERLWAGPGAEGPRVNLIARGAAHRPVCSLYYHVDTVPPGDGWTMPPLALTRAGNRLHGRGAADMKGTIAATWAALTAMKAAGLEPVYAPDLLFCTDEEGGLYPGIRHLAEQRLIRGHLLSFNGQAAPRFWAGCFGSLDLVIRVEGRAAHSGDGIGGINAVEEALPILANLVALKAKVETRTSALPPPPWREGEPLRARLNITAIRGGAKGSALPGACEIVLNRRYAPEESLEAVEAELEAAIRTGAAAGRALGVTITRAGHLAPVQDADLGPHWPRWRDAVSAGFGFPRESFRRWGATSSSDMGFVQQAGHREILLGGLSRPEARIHAADEYTTTDDIVSLATAILVYLADTDLPLAAPVEE